MQFNGIVGYGQIRDAAIIQKNHEGNNYTACAKACFTYPEFFPARPCSRKYIHDAGALKKDVPGFFNGIDNIEIAVVIMLVHKIGRNLHDFKSHESL